MPNQSVEVDILMALPPGTVSAEWLDLSGQLGDDFKPETSRMIQAVDRDGKVIYYAGHEANGAKPFFLKIHLPSGDVATEPGSRGVLRKDLIDALNRLAETP